MAGAFGVRGEVRLLVYTEDPAALLRYRELRGGNGAIALTLEAGRAAKTGEIVARASEVATREAAEALRGLELFVRREVLPEPEDEDEFYLTDLIGLRALDPEGADLGRVKAVLNHGAGDILEIDPGDGGATRLYPFTREVVPQVRLAERLIVIAPPHEVNAQAPDGDG